MKKLNTVYHKKPNVELEIRLLHGHWHWIVDGAVMSRRDIYTVYI